MYSLYMQPSVNIVLEFLSPENAPECIRLADEVRLLPQNHKAKGKYREVVYIDYLPCSLLVCNCF